jgi:hypothetical protein
VCRAGDDDARLLLQGELQGPPRKACWAPLPPLSVRERQPCRRLEPWNEQRAMSYCATQISCCRMKEVHEVRIEPLWPPPSLTTTHLANPDHEPGAISPGICQPAGTHRGGLTHPSGFSHRTHARTHARTVRVGVGGGVDCVGVGARLTVATSARRAGVRTHLPTHPPPPPPHYGYRIPTRIFVIGITCLIASRGTCLPSSSEAFP